jgi:hypothetical protein
MADVYTDNMTRLPSEVKRYPFKYQVTSGRSLKTYHNRLNEQFDLMTQYTGPFQLLLKIV